MQFRLDTRLNPLDGTRSPVDPYDVEDGVAVPFRSGVNVNRAAAQGLEAHNGLVRGSQADRTGAFDFAMSFCHSFVPF